MHIPKTELQMYKSKDTEIIEVCFFQKQNDDKYFCPGAWVYTYI